jgi:hypothetical protein
MKLRRKDVDQEDKDKEIKCVKSPTQKTRTDRVPLVSSR